MTQTEISKIEQWFQGFNKKIDRLSQEIISLRTDITDIRDFIEQQQSDIRLCKISIKHHDDKLEKIDHRMQKVEKKINH